MISTDEPDVHSSVAAVKRHPAVVEAKKQEALAQQKVSERSQRYGFEQRCPQAHNLRGRPPRMDAAHAALLKAYGAEMADDLTLHGPARFAGLPSSPPIARHGLAAHRGSKAEAIPADAALDGAPSCLFDAVVVMGDAASTKLIKKHPAALQWLRDAWRHLKVIGLDSGGRDLAKAAGIGEDDAVVSFDNKPALQNFCQWAARGKHIAREGEAGTEP